MGFLKDENGVSMVEYALIVGLLAGVVVVVLMVLGQKNASFYNKVNGAADEVNNLDNN